MPVTSVEGSPALNPSSDCGRHATPTLERIRSATCCAVSDDRCARAMPPESSAAVVPTRNSRLEVGSLFMVGDCNTGGDAVEETEITEFTTKERSKRASSFSSFLRCELRSLRHLLD